MKTKITQIKALLPPSEAPLRKIQEIWMNIDFLVGSPNELANNQLELLLQLHPIFVRPLSKQTKCYEVIAGHRSYQLIKSLSEDNKTITVTEMSLSDDRAINFALSELIYFLALYSPFTADDKVRKEIYQHLSILLKTSPEIKKKLPKNLSSSSKIRDFLKLTPDQVKSARRPASNLTKFLDS